MKIARSKISLVSILVIFVFTIAVLHSCTYNSIEELYPKTDGCDTVNVTYSGTIWPLIENNCYSCHSETNPSSGIMLNNYDNIALIANAGLLYGVINHEPDYIPMPKGLPKLDNCSINQVKIWIENGAPNN